MVVREATPRQVRLHINLCRDKMAGQAKSTKIKTQYSYILKLQFASYVFEVIWTEIGESIDFEK